MIVVTGGAGFIGSNLIHALNRAGRHDILVVDNLTKGVKFHNLVDCEFHDYLDKTEFRRLLLGERSSRYQVEAVLHQGACSTTTEWDGRYLMDNNYQYSKEVLKFCQDRRAQFIYASSAAVYGAGPEFIEDPKYARPLNMYGYSKLVFDRYVRKCLVESRCQIVGLRYFNVYGPREQHKGSMASVAYHFDAQLRDGNAVRLFEGSDGYAAGEQRRDFVMVDDVVAVNKWLLDNPAVSGIFNVGTGRAQSFNEVAQAVLAWHGRGAVEYIPFPEHLAGAYQSFTQANIEALRGAGYSNSFKDVSAGVKDYLDWLHR